MKNRGVTGDVLFFMCLTYMLGRYGKNGPMSDTLPKLLTPKTKLITNASYLQFADTSSMEEILQDGSIGRDIGFDLSVGVEYRPLLNNNVILTFGAAALIPGNGFKDLYTSETLYSLFGAATLAY